MVLAKKLLQMARIHGPVFATKRGLAYYSKMRRAARAVAAKPCFDSPESIIDFAFSPPVDGIQPFQVKSEILALVSAVHAQRPQNVMEVGTANGGTLLLWTRCAADNAHLISLDLPGGRFGGGYSSRRGKMYDDFALPGQTITRIRADSHSPKSLELVRKDLAGRQIDFLFLDGDHSYAGIKQDYETFAPLVRPKGIVAFHDIVKCSDASCQVQPFWDEVKQGKPWKEFIEKADQGWGGIGMVIC